MENKQENLNEKDFHDIVMKQYELINSQFNTIRQMQIDQEERDAEFDLTRLIPKFLRKNKNENAKQKIEKNKDNKLFKFILLSIAKYFKLIIIFTLLGFVYAIYNYCTTPKIYESKIKFASGALTNSYFEGQVEALGNIARNAPEYLTEKINISKDQARNIQNIKFSNFKDYTETRKRVVNDTTFESYEIYPFFEVSLYVTDNSILDDVEKGITEYLGNNPYINQRISTMSVSIENQLKDIEKHMDNLDTVIYAIIHNFQQTDKQKFFIKETGLDSKGIILNQNEPVNEILQFVTKSNEDFISMKGLLTDQLADIKSSKFSLVEKHTLSNNPFAPKLTSFVNYLIFGFVIGVFAAIFVGGITTLMKKMNEIAKSEND
ncbi:MAG: hypothetical protein IKQ46_14530 [Bacteroidales bacterium]|nr:hypothetical protein [Bacteroidales bacterium]